MQWVDYSIGTITAYGKAEKLRGRERGQKQCVSKQRGLANRGADVSFEVEPKAFICIPPIEQRKSLLPNLIFEISI